MAKEFLEMDSWTSEQVSFFKEQAKYNQEKTKLAFVGVPPETLMAEGDSWFDYMPGTDLIDCLRNNHQYVINNYANAGDTLENMIYGTHINKNFERTSPTINQVLTRIGELKPKVFLFSGGGNDIAGEEFMSYLNHKNSGLKALREQFLDDMINSVFRKYFEDLIAKVTNVSPKTHIVVHGYGHTAPTGEGVDFLFFTFAGPWLRPALTQKGIFDFNEQRNIVFTVIDKYNDMLKSLASQYKNFHHVDLRNILDPDSDWINELHLKNSAYARVAKQIHEVIKTLS